MILGVFDFYPRGDEIIVMTSEIPYSEFLRDIGRQKRRIINKAEGRQRELHPEVLDREEYDHLTQLGLYRPERPRPVWLNDEKKWTVGAPVNPIEWQILIQSERTRDRKPVTSDSIGGSILWVCGCSWIRNRTFYECVSSLKDRHLLKTRGKSGRSPIVDKWLHPDLTGPRAGGEWHRKSIRRFVDKVNRLYGCYTYVDRGYCPGVQMPDVILIRPELVEHTVHREPAVEPLEWDMENPVYAEFKSAGDMRNNPGRLEEQVERYDGIPLYLEVEARVNEARDMIEERGRRRVDLSDLLQKPEGDKVCLYGSERPWSEVSFEPVIEKIKEAFLETYDKKARLKKTGVDPQGREYHDLILYDSLNTPKNVGQVIPNYAEDIEDFADIFFDEWYLGRITTADYIYVPERKPTPNNKTWKWKKSKTKGSKFRSFSV